MRLPSDRARAVVLIANLVLVVALLAWCGTIAGLLLDLPLLALMPGLLRRRRYTAQWGSLLLVFYVAGLLAEGFAIHSRHRIAVALATVAAIEFVALNLFSRARGREIAARIGASPEESDGSGPV